MYYSHSKRGFFDLRLHGSNIPADAMEISSEEYRTLLVAQGNGKVIQPDENGRPVAVDPPAPPAPTEEELVATARAERDRLMCEVYDPTMMQLLRRHRTAVISGADTTEINTIIVAWDSYAYALERISEQPGFPTKIVWPQIP